MRVPTQNQTCAMMQLIFFWIALILALQSSPFYIVEACGACLVTSSSVVPHRYASHLLDHHAAFHRHGASARTVTAFDKYPVHLALCSVATRGVLHLIDDSIRTQLRRRINPISSSYYFEQQGGNKEVAQQETTSDKEQNKGTTQQKQQDQIRPISSSMLASIQFYKNFISPILPPACRFLPTCSTYGVEAIQTFGPCKGAILTTWRILRCSPFGGKGYDPPVWPPVAYNFGSY